MRGMELGLAIVFAAFGIGATCVDSGSLEQSDDPGLRGALPANSVDAGVPDDAEERPVTDDDATTPDAGVMDDRPRATFTSGLDLTTLRSEIIKTDGTIEDIGDEEIFLYPRNRARIYIAVANNSDGWVPINFELCTDNHEAVTVIDAEAVEGADGGPSPDYPEDSELAVEPCRVRFPSGEWPVIEQGDEVEFLTGAVFAYAHPAGGYLTIRFRAEFEALGEMDLYEYTVPYRVLPSGETKAWYVPRRAVLRRLVIELP